jgi:hypothetical protein
MDNFSDVVLIKLRNLSTGVRVITQPLHIFQYGIYKLLANVRHSLLQIVSFNLLEVTQGRAGDNDFHLFCAEYFLRLSQRDGITFPNISQSLGHGLDESQFFGSFLVFVEALHDSNPSASAGQQDWSVCIVHPAYDFAWVDLEIGQGNDIL